MSDLAILGWGMMIGSWITSMWVMRKDRADDGDRHAWMGRLGHALAAQFYKVDQNHRFVGDRAVVIVEQTYSGGGKSFLVSVQRKEPQNDEG